MELNNQVNIGETYFEIGILAITRKSQAAALQAFQQAKATFKKVGALENVKKAQNQIAALEAKKP